MMIIGCDFHPSFQQLAMLDTETGELVEKPDAPAFTLFSLTDPPGGCPTLRPPRRREWAAMKYATLG